MRVATGAVARQLLAEFGIKVAGQVIRIGDVEVQRQELPIDELIRITEESPVRVVDKEAEAKMIAAIDAAKEDGDTLVALLKLLSKACLLVLAAMCNGIASWMAKLHKPFFPFKRSKVLNSELALKQQSAEALMFMMKSYIQKKMALDAERIVQADLKAE